MPPLFTLISCNFPSFLSIPKTQNPKLLSLSPLKSLQFPRNPLFPLSKFQLPTTYFKASNASSLFPSSSTNCGRVVLQKCCSSLNSENPKDPLEEDGFSLERRNEVGSDSTGGIEGDWTTSILLFVLWSALMYYIFQLTPDQTPIRDMYFLKKLLNLKGDDGFRMNEVLVSLWYIMGLWPLVYSMLLLPNGRSSRSKVPVWPFLLLSFFGGVYAILPYFILWRPPPPALDESELGKWPLNFLESKITAGVLFLAGIGIITYAGLANADDWQEFYQYFRESKFIHITSIDFTLLSAFSPFWVYNDMTARKWEPRMLLRKVKRRPGVQKSIEVLKVDHLSSLEHKLQIKEDIWLAGLPLKFSTIN